MAPYILSAHDNDIYLFRRREDVRRCPRCSELLAKWDEDLRAAPTRRVPKLDVSYTYDGVMVCSSRFVRAVESSGLIDLAIRPLWKGFSWVMPTLVVRFDPERRGTRFENLCPSCGRFESVIGATPAFLQPGESVAENGFARTDLEFGSNDEKGPLIICGAYSAEVLKIARLTGIEIEPIVT